MGEGLKRVAKQCGGLTVKTSGKTVYYDENGRLRRLTADEQKMMHRALRRSIKVIAEGKRK